MTNKEDYLNGVCSGIEYMINAYIPINDFTEYYDIKLNFFDTSKNSFEEELRKSHIESTIKAIDLFKKDELERSVSHEIQIKIWENQLEYLKSNPIELIKLETDYLKRIEPTTAIGSGFKKTWINTFQSLENILLDLCTPMNNEPTQELKKLAKNFSSIMQYVFLSQGVGEILSIYKIDNVDKTIIADYHVAISDCYLINFKEGSILLTYGFDD
ncbi:MAG: hypothetical protein ACI4WH_07930 [Oscillospiraceae bacterium]